MYGFSLNDWKNLCENDGEKIPSVFDFNSKTIQFEIQNFEFKQPLFDRVLPSLTRIRTDGKLDYDSEKWTDSVGTPIPDDFWENFSFYRKACWFSRGEWSQFMIHKQPVQI